VTGRPRPSRAARSDALDERVRHVCDSLASRSVQRDGGGESESNLGDMSATDPIVCRRCGKFVTRPTGTGRRRDGVFCGVECFAIYYAKYLANRAEHIRGQSYN
jgi:hypothetical protein